MRARPLALSLIIFSAAIAMVTGAWHFSNERQRMEGPRGNLPLVLNENPESQENDATIVEPLSSSQNLEDSLPNEPDRAMEIAQEFMNASRSSLAEDAINDAEVLGLKSSADWRMQLDVACNPKELEYLYAQAKSEQQKYLKMLESYCEGYVPSQDFSKHGNLVDFDNTFQSLLRTTSREMLSKELSDRDGDEVDDYIVHWLKTATSPEQIHAVGDYLSEFYNSTGQVAWRPNVGNQDVSEVVITSLQGIALELYSCQRFGGCGPESLKMIRICAFVLGCKPGWTFEEYVFSNHSPIEMGYIRQLLTHIYNG